VASTAAVQTYNRADNRAGIRERSHLRRIVAASIVLAVVVPVLSACGPAPTREWPIWTGGGIYDSPDSYRGPVN